MISNVSFANFGRLSKFSTYKYRSPYRTTGFQAVSTYFFAKFYRFWKNNKKMGANDAEEKLCILKSSLHTSKMAVPKTKLLTRSARAIKGPTTPPTKPKS